jgi:hypothetical protein
MTFSPQSWTDPCGSGIHAFIHDNFLAIGYVAWHGYQAVGRGLVVCEAPRPIPTDSPWRDRPYQPMPDRLQFVPLARVSDRLQALAIDHDTQRQVLHVLRHYCPSQDIILLSRWGQDLEIDHLQNLAIAPAQCHAQIMQHWSEFQPCFTDPIIDQG